MLKTRYFTFVMPFLLVSLLLSVGCSKTPDEKFDTCLVKAAAGQPKALEQIEELLINAAIKETFPNEERYSDGKILWKKTGNDINILYPQKASFKMQNENMNLMRSVDSTTAAFSDEVNIFIFDLNGKLKKSFVAGTEKDPVQALTVSNGSVFYCQKNKIYQISETDDIGTVFVKDTFNPPYARLFNTAMYVNGNKLGLLLGVAGSYYFNVIDIEQKKTINTQIRMSSANLFLKEDSVLYISGDTGNWTFTKFQFASGRKNTYQRYKEIYNVDIFPNELIVEHGDGIYIGTSNKEDIKLPSTYVFKGQCGELALIQYKDFFYGIDTAKLYSLLETTNKAIPDVFH